MSENPHTSLNIDDLWDALLSRQPEQVRAAFRSLEPDQQHSVLAHLQRMTSEPGWHLNSACLPRLPWTPSRPEV